MKTKINTVCSNCGIKVVLDLQTEIATALVPGNGLRGQKHVPGGVRTTDLFEEDNGLLAWECPKCEYPDTYDVYA